MDRRTRWTAVRDGPPYAMDRRTRWTAVSDERPIRGFAGHFVRFGEEAKPAAPGQSQEWCQLAPPAPRCLSTQGGGLHAQIKAAPAGASPTAVGAAASRSRE